MASFMEEALVAQLKRVEKIRGEPFPSRAGATLKTRGASNRRKTSFVGGRYGTPSVL
jgi:hypothetical protein